MLTTKKLESLGFVFLKKEGYKSVFINDCHANRGEKICFGEIYEDKRYIAIENNCGQFYFMGWVKNKKELKKILKQVGVFLAKTNQNKALMVSWINQKRYNDEFKI
jgi:hypothetical protein